MNLAEMKKEINEKVKSLKEYQLKMVEQFIEKINSSEEKEMDLKIYVNDPITERTKVLQKLAQ